LFHLQNIAPTPATAELTDIEPLRAPENLGSHRPGIATPLTNMNPAMQHWFTMCDLCVRRALGRQRQRPPTQIRQKNNPQVIGHPLCRGAGCAINADTRDIPVLPNLA